MKSFLNRALLLLLFSFISPSPFGVELKRDVIAFWDSAETEENEYTFSPTHRYLESVFNHYGFRLNFVDVNRPFPGWLNSPKELKKYQGAVSWFMDNSMKQAQSYMSFLMKAKKQGLALLLLGEPGFHETRPGVVRGESELKKIWSELGMRYQEGYYSNPLLMTNEFNTNPQDVQFERSYDSELPGFWALSIKDPRLKSWMSIKTTEDESRLFHPVVVGKKVAVVQRGFEIFTNPIDYKVKWRINPFKVVEELFYQEKSPIPDLTTQCGRRASFIHIDGDGFINVSLTDKKSLSGEVVIEEIIKPYGFPTSASVVTAEVLAKYLGSEKTESLVRDLYQLDNVEAATHTFRHPLSWEKNPGERERKIYLQGERLKSHKGSIVAYMSDLGVLNYQQEILDSAASINELLPEGRKTKMIFWSGSCRPPKDALKLTHEAGLLNMNGGDGRYDGTYSSYAGLSPLYRNIDGLLQPYSAFANENIYTNLWEGPFSGFRNVIQSFKNTESPIRIKPINVYYHFYSGERVSSLKALHEVYRYLGEQKLFYLYAGQYSQMVQDWHKLEMTRKGKNSYQVSNYGLVRTLRFDLKGESLFPDYKKSKNVVGHKLYQGQLYITLSKGQKAQVVLTNNAPDRPYISECNGFIDTMDDSSIEGQSNTNFEAIFFNKKKSKEVSLKNYPQKSFKVKEWRP